jgi:hypothetical protein
LSAQGWEGAVTPRFFRGSLGNEKNHEIKIGTKDEAAKILKFIEALLIFMYEFLEEPLKNS